VEANKVSIGICGYIDFQSNKMEEMDELSFYVMSKAIEYRIGCKMGGNISREADSLLDKGETDSAIVFELMETPLDNYANGLCQPSIDIQEEIEADISIKINENMRRLQKFLECILNYQKVNRIVLQFDYLFENEESNCVEINVQQFTDFMNQAYEDNDCVVPKLRVNIIKYI
jgi:hypothetical protein